MSVEAEVSATNTDLNSSPEGSSVNPEPNDLIKGARKKKNSVRPPKTVFSSKPLLLKQAKAATTAQIRALYEEVGLILETREAEDRELERVEKEQTERAQEILAKAAESGIPKEILMKVMAG